MLEFIETAPEVLAFRIGGRIEGADLDAVLDRLEPMLDRPGKVHVFVETRTITGIALDGLGRYTVRATPLLGKLGRFGRVAVAADQTWVRVATRLESLILPFISYRIFEPHEAAGALAWVETGRDASA